MKSSNKKTTIFFKDLTKKEVKHLHVVAEVKTLTSFKSTAAYQKQCRDRGEIEPCYYCKDIARRLGIEV